MAGDQKFKTRTDLTPGFIKKLGSRNQIFEVPDSRVIGLRIVVYPSGERSFAIRYEMGDGRARKHTIGPFPRLKVSDARRIAAKKLRDVHGGIDPGKAKAADRKAAKSGTVTDAFGKFETDHLAKKKSAKETKRIFNKYVLPRLGKKPLVSVTKSDVIDILKSIPAPQMSNRTFSAMSKFFKWCSAHDRIPVPPTLGVARLHDMGRARDRVLSDNELRWLFMAADKLELMGRLYKALAITGSRLSEMSKLQWDEINWQERLISLEGHRMKTGHPHKIFITDLLKSVLSVKRSGDYVFGVRNKPPTSFSKAKKALDAEMARVAKEEFEQPPAPFQTKDFRRTFRTNLARLGVASEIAERCSARIAGPSFSGVKGVYNRWGYPREMEDAFTRHADHLTKIIGK